MVQMDYGAVLPPSQMVFLLLLEFTYQKSSLSGLMGGEVVNFHLLSSGSKKILFSMQST